MKILLLNWKDIKNPSAGGAEILTHELAKGFVKKGHIVYMFSSKFKKSKKFEIIDGVKIYRGGTINIRNFFNSVQFKAYLFYKTQMEGKIDIVIDEIHGVPFYTPLYIKEPKIALICEVANDIWDKMFSFPWNILGKYNEKFSLYLYKKLPFLTISNSTKNDLILKDIKNITVLPMGITRTKHKIFKKENSPTIIYVGRLNKMKGIEDGILAFSLVLKKYKNAKLWIVGRGEEKYVLYLKNLTKKHNITSSVFFWDFITEEKKFELMSKAHIIAVPSIREGFGLIVPEAGSVGTPAVVYDVPGLKDIVSNNINGIVVQKKSYEALAKGIIKILSDKKLYANLTNGAKKSSEQYRWSNTVKVCISIINKYT